MALSRETAVIKALWRARKLIGQWAGQIAYEDVDTYHDDACRRLGDRVIAGQIKGAHPSLVMKLVSNVSTSGNVTDIPSNIIVQSIAPLGTVTANGVTLTRPLQYKPFLEDLLLGGLAPEWDYYTIVGATAGSSILSYSYTGLPLAPASVNIRAGVYPAAPNTAAGNFTDLEEQLENELIDMLVEIIGERMGEPNSQLAPPAEPRTTLP